LAAWEYSAAAPITPARGVACLVLQQVILGRGVRSLQAGVMMDTQRLKSLRGDTTDRAADKLGGLWPLQTSHRQSYS